MTMTRYSADAVHRQVAPGADTTLCGQRVSTVECTGPLSGKVLSCPSCLSQWRQLGRPR